MQIRSCQGSKPCEVIWLASILVIFFGINFSTIALSPTVGIDEVMFTDPAVNLRLFGRFTSAAWFAQVDQEFWSGYPPLYSLLLSVWLGLAPISPAGVRSLNLVLMALASIAMWLALRRSELIRSPGTRLLFVALVLCSYCTAFSYRSGRPDTLGILLMSLLALVAARKPSGLRLVFAFALGALLPWAGLQFVAYVAVLSILAVLVAKRIILIAVVLAAGVAAGGVALALLYISMGTLNGFVESVQPNIPTALGGARHASLFTAVRPLLFTDYGTLLLLPTLALIAVISFGRTPDDRQVDRHMLLFFILVVMIVPPLLYLVGKYPIYYFWMSFIPLSVLAVFVIDNASPRQSYAWYIAFGLVCITALVGLPARTAFALLEADGWDYARVSAHVGSTMRGDDTVFTDFPAAYYPAKLRARKVYLPPYLPLIPRSERRDISVAILVPRPAFDPKSFLSKEFGGDWEKIGPDYAPSQQQRFSFAQLVGFAPPYQFSVWRRQAISNFGSPADTGKHSPL